MAYFLDIQQGVFRSFQRRQKQGRDINNVRGESNQAATMEKASLKRGACGNVFEPAQPI